MRRLNPKKEIVFTKHIGYRWVGRLSNQLSLSDIRDQMLVIKRLKEILNTGHYTLIEDGREYAHNKFRLVCSLWGEYMTFVVIDAESLVFKTLWSSKTWEVKKLEDEMSNM